MKAIAWLLGELCLLALASSLQAANLYSVRQDGTGDYTTIQQAVNHAQPGDTVVVHAGNYSETASPTFVSVISGAAGSVITIRAAEAETAAIDRAVISHDYIRVQGFKIIASYGYYASGIGVTGNHVSVSNNTFIGSGGLDYAMYITGSDATIEKNVFDGLGDANKSYFIVLAIEGGNNALVLNNIIKNMVNSERIIDLGASNCLIRENEVYGMTWVNEPGVHPDIFQTVTGCISQNNIIEKNYFHDCNAQIGNINSSDDGMQVSGWIFRNNVFKNIEQSCFLYGKNFKFYNNTFYRVGSPWNMLFVLYNDAYGDASGFTLQNNIIIGNAESDSLGWWCAGAGVISDIVADYNYISKPDYAERDGYPAGAHDINGNDPGFVAANSGDFHLRADSPLRRAGLDLSGAWPNPTDKDNAIRPQNSSWAIGAYEYRILNSPTPSAENNFSRVYAFPNPYKACSGGAYDSPQGIVFANLPGKAVLKIFSLSGELVFKHEKDSADSNYAWKVVNASGKQLASGVYIYLVSNPNKPSENARGKVVVIR